MLTMQDPSVQDFSRCIDRFGGNSRLINRSTVQIGDLNNEVTIPTRI